MKVKELKNTDTYKYMEGRTKLKLKIEIRDAIYSAINNKRLKNGSFSGIRNLDGQILLYLSDLDLSNLFCVNKYFNSFKHHQPFWKLKVYYRLVSHTSDIEDWARYYRHNYLWHFQKVSKRYNLRPHKKKVNMTNKVVKKWSF